jgi:diguanylate cyclase (GGDEF)-like protein
MSRFLEDVGYEVSQVTDTRLAIAALERCRYDFVLARSLPALSELREAFRQRPRILVGLDDAYKFLLVSVCSKSQVADALEANVDDFLCLPIDYAELLARLRTGARVVEQRRRMRRQRCVDLTTDLPTLLSFCRMLDGMILSNSVTQCSVTCIAWNVDFFGHVRSRHGEPFADRILQALGSELGKRLGQPIACGGDDQFIVALADVSEADAVDWAERLRQEAADLTIRIDDNEVHVTVSCGVASVNGETISSEELVKRAIDAQSRAKTCGRNCVVSYSQLQRDDETFAPQVESVFSRTLARDVMVPCTRLLQGDDLVAKARSAFQRSAMSVIPVVDDTGALTGYVDRDDILSLEADDSHVKPLARPRPQCFDEKTPLSRLMDFYADEDRSLVFLLRKGVLSGYITRETLASLSEPADASTFATTASPSVSSQYLLVPDRGMAAPA